MLIYSLGFPHRPYKFKLEGEIMSEVKRFKLHDPSISNIEIAQKLGHKVRSAYPTFEIPAGFISGTWVGARSESEDRSLLILGINYLELHEEARKFADEIC